MLCKFDKCSVKSITLDETHSVVAQNNISIPNSPMHYSPDNNDRGTITVTGEDEIKLIGHTPPPLPPVMILCSMWDENPGQSSRGHITRVHDPSVSHNPLITCIPDSDTLPAQLPC